MKKLKKPLATEINSAQAVAFLVFKNYRLPF